MFAPEKILRNWSDQRPSDQDDLDEGQEEVGSVCYFWYNFCPVAHGSLISF